MVNHDRGKAGRGLGVAGGIQRRLRLERPQLIRLLRGSPGRYKRGVEVLAGGYLGPITTVADSKRQVVLEAAGSAVLTEEAPAPIPRRTRSNSFAQERWVSDRWLKTNRRPSYRTYDLALLCKG